LEEIEIGSCGYDFRVDMNNLIGVMESLFRIAVIVQSGQSSKYTKSDLTELKKRLQDSVDKLAKYEKE